MNHHSAAAHHAHHQGQHTTTTAVYHSYPAAEQHVVPIQQHRQNIHHRVVQLLVPVEALTNVLNG